MSQDDPWIGRTLSDRFTLQSVLGQGGMATVYRATDPKLDRQVAVKIIRDDVSASLGSERFKKEIRLLSTLNHPNIVGLIDSGTTDGSLFYVMPLIEGQTLRDRLDSEGRLPIEESVRLTTEVGIALGHAHGLGIIHRDVKPENIMLLGRAVAVADFGIAKVLGESADERLTSTGIAIGTVNYMSPEQSLGLGSIDHRSDQYSLAAVLYEMLAGEAPFTGPNAQAIIARKNLESPRSILPVRGTVSAGLEAVVLRGLARDPVDRYGSIAEFLEALAGAETSLTAEVVSASPDLTKVGRLVQHWRAIAVLGVAAAGAAMLIRGGVLGSGGSGVVEPWSLTNRARIVFLQCRADGTPDAVGSGILAAITSRLQSVGAVVPISSSAADRFSDSSLGLQAIADSLAADYVANCAVDSEEVEFILSDHRGRELWTDKFTGADLVGETTVLNLLAGLGVEPSAEEVAAIRSYQSSSPIADSLYQLAVGYRAMADDTLNNLSLELLLSAVDHDPSFGPAWSGLARVYSYRLRNLGTRHDRVEASLSANRTAEAGVNLAPLIPDTYVALATVQMWDRFDFVGARESLRAALLLSPSHFEALSLLAFLHAWENQADSAMFAIDKAAETAPMDGLSILTHGFIAYLVGDLETALSDYRWINQFAGSPQDNGLLGWALIEAGRLDEASVGAEVYCAAEQPDPCWSAPRYVAAARGDTIAVLAAVRAMRRDNVPWRPNHAFVVAEFFAMAGMIDSAFSALDEAAVGPSPFLTRLRVDPHFELLRSDPRFSAFGDSLGLPVIRR